MRKLTLFTFLMAFLVIAVGHSQKELTWNDLGDVSFKPNYDSPFEMEFKVPLFGYTIKEYEGKSIKIKGYFLDISGTGQLFLLSKYPMAQCFFCGGGGPETIMEVYFKTKPEFKTDQIIEVTGILKLNTSDEEHCNYILNDATGKLAD